MQHAELPEPWMKKCLHQSNPKLPDKCSPRRALAHQHDIPWQAGLVSSACSYLFVPRHSTLSFHPFVQPQELDGCFMEACHAWGLEEREAFPWISCWVSTFLPVLAWWSALHPSYHLKLSSCFLLSCSRGTGSAHGCGALLRYSHFLFILHTQTQEQRYIFLCHDTYTTWPSYH